MNRVLRTFFFAATSGTSAAGLAVLFIVLAFPGEPKGGVGLVAVYAALGIGGAAAVLGAVLYWVFMRAMTIDAFARIIGLTLLAELVVGLGWDAVGPPEMRWFGAFLVLAWVLVLVVLEARRGASGPSSPSASS